MRVTFLFAGVVAAIAASHPVSAKIAKLYLTCGPSRSLTQDTKVDQSVLGSTISRIYGQWTINYRLADGRTIARNDQYDMTPSPDDTIMWTGRLRTNPNLEMIGEIERHYYDGGRYTYRERLRDNGRNGETVTFTIADCTRVTDLVTLTPSHKPAEAVLTPAPSPGMAQAEPMQQITSQIVKARQEGVFDCQVLKNNGLTPTVEIPRAGHSFDYRFSEAYEQGVQSNGCNILRKTR